MLKTINQKVEEIREKCRLVRKYTMEMTVEVEGGVHFGPAYSIIEILGVLYFGVMNINPENPRWEERDRFILSKGHGVASLYPTMSLAGYYPLDELKLYGAQDSHLGMHPSLDISHGIEASTGSLGQGLSFGAGMSLAGKINKRDYRTFVLLGNGECNEGQIWECAMSAAHYGLDNLVAIAVSYTHLGREQSLDRLPGLCRDHNQIGSVSDPGYWQRTFLLRCDSIRCRYIE